MWEGGRGEEGGVGQLKQKSVDLHLAIQNKNPSRKTIYI
jgi:hypothetical protein